MTFTARFIDDDITKLIFQMSESSLQRHRRSYLLLIRQLCKMTLTVCVCVNKEVSTKLDMKQTNKQTKTIMASSGTGTPSTSFWFTITLKHSPKCFNCTRWNNRCLQAIELRASFTGNRRGY